MSRDEGNSWDCYFSHTEESGSDYWDPYQFYKDFYTTSDCYDAPQYCDDEFANSPGYGPTDRTRLPDEGFQTGENSDKPDCSNPATVTNLKQRAFCAAKKNPLSMLERQKVVDALHRIRDRGGHCTELADIGDALLNRGDMQFFPRSNYRFNGAAPVGGGSTGSKSWMILDKTWITRWYDPNHRSDGSDDYPDGIDLQAAMAHELDHLAGSNHIEYNDGTKSQLLTPYTVACSDLPEA